MALQLIACMLFEAQEKQTNVILLVEGLTFTDYTVVNLTTNRDLLTFCKLTNATLLHLEPVQWCPSQTKKSLKGFYCDVNEQPD